MTARSSLNLVLIARRHRAAARMFVAAVVGVTLPIALPIVLGILSAGAWSGVIAFQCGVLGVILLQVLAAIQVWRLLRAMGERGPDPLPGAIICVLPLFNWLFIPLMLDHAAQALRRHGLPVGIFGVSEARLAVLPTDCCPKCWYDMQGLETNVCPECGVRMIRRNKQPADADA